MSKILDEVLAANAAYVAGFGSKGDLALPPARGLAILTCMARASIRRNTRVSRKATRM